MFHSEGRGAAAEVDAWLSGTTRLPSAGGIKQRVKFLLLEPILETDKVNQVFVTPPSVLSQKVPNGNA
jgi:hypothetical protein